MPKRNGTNFQDRNAIKEYVDQGVTNPALIAANLNLVEGPVASYVETLVNPPKPKATRKPRQPKAETETPPDDTAESPFGAAAAEG